MADHALLSPSGSSRWLACPPSARLDERFPNKTSEFAEEGTFAHKLAELEARYVLEQMHHTHYYDQLDELKTNKWYNQEMQEHTEAYAKFVCERLDDTRKEDPYAFAELEAYGEFGEYAPEGFGTCDCVIVSSAGLEIIDFKYGRGVKVEAGDNSQMRLYALAALGKYDKLYDFTNARMTIFQPRRENGLTTEVLSVQDLLSWGDEYVRPRAELAFNGQGEFAPSEETCKFCGAKELCAARAETFVAQFDDTPDPLFITLDQAAEYLRKAQGLVAWVKDLENLVSTKLFEGVEVPGWKFVEGRSNRKIVDESGAASALLAAGCTGIYKPEQLRGITELEKALGKKRFGELVGPFIVKPAGAPKLTLDTDPRPAYTPESLLINSFEEEI